LDESAESSYHRLMELPVYQRPGFVIDRGEGCYLWDTAGRRYLDFFSGVGVNALGHSHPRIRRVIEDQAARCLHTSNLYHHPWREPLARRLAEWARLDRVFFGNSGAEAMETALKAARARGVALAPEKFEIVALENSFHGRTLGALSITGRARYREGFGPLLDGVRFAPANDIDSLRAAVSTRTAAIVVEPIQGEGGVHVLSDSFLLEARLLACRCRALLIADETQCGLGRAGHRFAFQRVAGLEPDIVVTAKPLAAGLPLSAAILSAGAAEPLSPGRHGSTFGGGPLACRVALEVLDLIDGMLPHIHETGRGLHQRLAALALARGLPSGSVRGIGMIAGLDIGAGARTVVEAAYEQGAIIGTAGETVLRFLPPYIAGSAELGHLIAALAPALDLASPRATSGSLLTPAAAYTAPDAHCCSPADASHPSHAPVSRSRDWTAATPGTSPDPSAAPPGSHP
jgi:acetylornithine/succinyldiaminopimelate/putrescine aminotransferase